MVQYSNEVSRHETIVVLLLIQGEGVYGADSRARHVPETRAGGRTCKADGKGGLASLCVAKGRNSQWQDSAKSFHGKCRIERGEQDASSRRGAESEG